jgi:methionine-gamma-lyase
MSSHDGGFHTRSIHSGQDPVTGAVSVPIYQSSTFAFENTNQGSARFAGTEDGYIYTRLGNPTIRALEDCVANLEGGYRGLATASGMAAVCAVYVATLGQGAHVVSSCSVYGPSRTVLEQHFSRFGVDATFVHTETPGEIEKAIRPETRLVYVETPANPTVEITDLARAAEAAHAAGALLCVDNTFCSPCLQRPIEHGCDIVLHSMTKFLNGHADVVAGILVAKDEATFAKLRPVVTSFGGRWTPTRRGWFSVASSPCRCASTGVSRTRWRSPPCSRRATRSSGFAIRACRATPPTSWLSARWTGPARSSPSS